MIRGRFLAVLSAGVAVAALAACAPQPAPGNGSGNYVICDDTVANANCPDNTASVVVTNDAAPVNP